MATGRLSVKLFLFFEKERSTDNDTAIEILGFYYQMFTFYRDYLHFLKYI